MLDKPLMADTGGGDYTAYSKIVLSGNDTQRDQLKKLTNHHVIIEGKLGRFTSAMVDPPIMIEVTNIKE
jgi:hypothetical protein